MAHFEDLPAARASWVDEAHKMSVRPLRRGSEGDQARCPLESNSDRSLAFPADDRHAARQASIQAVPTDVAAVANRHSMFTSRICSTVEQRDHSSRGEHTTTAIA